MGSKEDLKAQLKQDPSFRAELKDRIKGAMGLRVPPAQAVNYNFDSYMLQDVEVGQPVCDFCGLLVCGVQMWLLRGEDDRSSRRRYASRN